MIADSAAPRGVEALPHQARALSQLRRQPAAHAIFMDPGTGKTHVAIRHIEQVWRPEASLHALVAAPKGVHRQWAEQQIPVHSTLGGAAFWWDGKKFRRARDASGPGPTWYTFNYDAFRSKDFKLALHRAIDNNKYALIADESHYIKNPTTARSKAMISLGGDKLCIARLALTGTPVTTTLEDLWGQFKFIDPSIINCKYRTAFRRQYCVMGGYENRQIVGYQNEERLYECIRPYTITLEQEEIKQIPDEYRSWEFDLCEAQKAAIKQAKEDILIDIESGIITDITLAIQRIAKIQQISNGWVMGSKGPMEIAGHLKNPRIEALKEWLGEGDLETNPVAIWGRYRHDIALIARAIKHAPVYEYHGGISSQGRAEAIEGWMNGGGVFLGTPGAGGVGLNLQGRCRQVLYWSQSESYTERKQSEARFSRIGKSGPIEFTTLIARGSRDAAISRILGRKDTQFQHTIEGIRDELQ